MTTHHQALQQRQAFSNRSRLIRAAHILVLTTPPGKSASASDESDINASGSFFREPVNTFIIKDTYAHYS